MEIGSPPPPTSRGSLLYLPLSPSGSGGDGGGIDCVEIRRGLRVAKLLPMLFAAMTLTIVDAVATVANNINSNNNNNNNQVYVTVQGDTSGCGEPPVDIKTTVPFWPGVAWPGQN